LCLRASPVTTETAATATTRTAGPGIQKAPNTSSTPKALRRQVSEGLRERLASVVEEQQLVPGTLGSELQGQAVPAPFRRAFELELDTPLDPATHGQVLR
jgi:hypothetical protein